MTNNQNTDFAHAFNELQDYISFWHGDIRMAQGGGRIPPSLTAQGGGRLPPSKSLIQILNGLSAALQDASNSLTAQQRITGLAGIVSFLLSLEPRQQDGVPHSGFLFSDLELLSSALSHV